jgi:hypothetical protein
MINTEEKKRDCKDAIYISKDWEWKNDWDNFKYNLNLNWDDISKLCHSDLKFLKDKIVIKESYAGHFGIQKYISLSLKDGTRPFRVMGEQTGQILFELNGEPGILFDDNVMISVINELFDCKTEVEFNKKIKEYFPNDIVRQCGLVLTFAYNNSLLGDKYKNISYE